MFDWAVFRNDVIISPHFISEQDALAYANENELILISKGQTWYAKGITIKEVR